MANLISTAPLLAYDTGARGRTRTSALPAKAAAAAPALAAAQVQQVVSNVRQLAVATSDIVYDRQTQKIYASVPSRAGADGNSIAEIDPVAGAPVQSFFIGSEPNRLALSDDGQTLYAGLDGAAAIRRFDIASHTAGLQFPVGNGSDGTSSPLLAGVLAVAPGNPNLLAVARVRPGSSSPASGVAIFDNGVRRPNTTPDFSSSDSIAFSAAASTLYGNAGGLQTMTVDASGVQINNTGSFNFSGNIQFAGGLVYSSSGKVFNPATNSLLGTFAGVGTGPFVVDVSVGRAYYVTGNSTNLNQTVTLKAFDINSFLPVGEMTVSGVNGVATSLVRWGTNGLAFRTSVDQLFLIQTSLVPSPDPIPTPSPTPVATPTPTPTPFDLSVRQIALNTKDLVYNPAAQAIYASVPSSAGPQGNSVTTIDPVAATTRTPVFVGSEPTKLALSENGQSLYVGLNGAGAVRRFNIVTQTPDLLFSLGNDSFTGPFVAGDMDVMPGRAETVAVSRNSASFNGGSTDIAIFDDGVARTKTAGGGGSVKFSSPTRLFSNGNFSAGILRHKVDATGVTFDTSYPSANGGSLRVDNGLIFTGNGSVLDADTGVLKGTFTGDNIRSNSIMTTDAALGRAYFLTISGLTGLLRVYDTNTFRPLGSVTIPNIGFTQNPDGFQFSSLIRWGQNGLAFRTTTHVIIIQSPVINPTGTVPAPTPLPSPTPTPSPTPEAPTFVRRVPLTINDFAYQATAQKLYVSLPSSAGPRGNSITPVDPATGAVGQSVFVGSEPKGMAISDNGQFIYTWLEGAQAIRRFDVASQTPGLQFPITNIRPTDMEVMPGSPQTLALTSGSTPLIFDDGVQRANSSSNFIRVGQIEFSSNPTILYGYNNGDTGFDFFRMNIGSNSGITSFSSARGLAGGFNAGIKFADGRIYVTTGRVFDPETFRLLGTFSNVGTFTAVAVDTALHRAFFAVENASGVILRAYDLDTFMPVGSVTMPSVAGTPTRMVRWGTNGLALRTFVSGSSSSESRLYLIQSALVSTAAPVPTGMQFGAESFFIGEGNNSIAIPVTRTGDLSASATVDYATSDGTASERSDYTTTSGTLTFAPGESRKTFNVLITDDALVEGNETINLTLNNVTGAEPTAPSTALLTIQDNDFGTPTGNPVDASTFFVRQQYADFLNRIPDQSGLSFWTNQIESCGADTSCREVRRINVSAAFFLSIEFQQTGYLVYRLQKSSFGTLPRYAPFLRDTQAIGRGVIVGTSGWEQQLESNKQTLIAAWVNRAAFKSIYDGLSNAQYVDALVVNTGVNFAQTERDALVNGLNGGQETRATVLRKVAENPAFSQAESNRAFVLAQYFGYLRRNPDDAPDANFDGYNFWLNKLNQFGGNFIEAEMVKAFIISGEYRKRFGLN
ncbi:MAG: DUF4214 domain-containing protein [Acidobacteria bacterium]|nr:DUF4214 domain-containing protein [Acidobacteriota bacterium]